MIQNNNRDAKVRAATSADIPRLAEVLARAFDQDPIFLWWVRQDRRRAKTLEWFFEVMLRERWIPHGEVTTTTDVDACAVWLPPGEWRTRMSLWEQICSLPKLVRITSLPRLPRPFIILRQMEKNHPDAEPHFYLAFLGTSPGRQGAGLGTALLTATLSRLDQKGLGAYLENSNPRNACFYERHGFETIKELRIPKGDLNIWCMWRKPVGNGPAAGAKALSLN